MITFSHSIGEKMKHQYQSFTRIGRQFQSLERQVYADWTSVSFPLCQRSCLTWRIMTNILTNTMNYTYVVIFLSASIFGRSYHSRYQKFECTGDKTPTISCTRQWDIFPSLHLLTIWSQIRDFNQMSYWKKILSATFDLLASQQVHAITRHIHARAVHASAGSAYIHATAASAIAWSVFVIDID